MIIDEEKRYLLDLIKVVVNCPLDANTLREHLRHAVTQTMQAPYYGGLSFDFKKASDILKDPSLIELVGQENIYDYLDFYSIPQKNVYICYCHVMKMKYSKFKYMNSMVSLDWLDRYLKNTSNNSDIEELIRQMTPLIAELFDGQQIIHGRKKEIIAYRQIAIKKVLNEDELTQEENNNLVLSWILKIENKIVPYILEYRALLYKEALTLYNQYVAKDSNKKILFQNIEEIISNMLKEMDKLIVKAADDIIKQVEFCSMKEQLGEIDELEEDRNKNRNQKQIITLLVADDYKIPQMPTMSIETLLKNESSSTQECWKELDAQHFFDIQKVAALTTDSKIKLIRELCSKGGTSFAVARPQAVMEEAPIPVVAKPVEMRCSRNLL